LKILTKQVLFLIILRQIWIIYWCSMAIIQLC